MKVKEPEVKEQDALEVFHQCDSIKKGHFIITPDLHTTVSINVYAVLAHITKAHRLCYGIAERFADKDAEVVVGLDAGGEIVAPWTAQNMSNITGRQVIGVSANKVSDDLVGGKNVLVVDGILTTGDTAREVIAAVQKIGGNTVGLGALWNRGGVRAQDVDVPKIHALVNIRYYAWTSSQCVHCELGIPITQG